MIEQAATTARTGTSGERREGAADAPPTISPTIRSAGVPRPEFTPPCNTHATAGKMSVLYFVYSGDLLKVGIANDLAARMKGYRLHNPTIGKPRYLSVPRPMARQIERRVHAALAAYLDHGEWFRVDRALAMAAAKPIIARGRSALRQFEREGRAIAA